MKKLFGVSFLLFLINFISSVAAQPFYYDYWYDFWYAPYPYFLYDSSFGFFLIIACLIALILAPMFHTYVPAFKEDNKRFGSIVAFLIGLIVAATTPFAQWLMELLNLSVTVLGILLFIFIIYFGWVFLYKGWSYGSEQINKAAKSSATPKKERIEAEESVESARDISNRRRTERAIKREELSELRSSRKDTKERLDRLGGALRKHYLVVKDTKKVEERISRLANSILLAVRGAHLTPADRRLISDVTGIALEIKNLQEDIERRFGSLWTEYKGLKRIGDANEMDRARRLARAMPVEVRGIHRDIRKFSRLETKFNRDFTSLQTHFAAMGIVI